jgi:Flp pilus assembly protein TadD
MAHASRPRRSLALALLATTAAGCLLGACNQTGGLFARSNYGSEEKQMSAAEAAGATAQWARAYAKDPQNPKMALGYAKTLKAIGSRDRALDIMTAAYRANPDNGEIAAELGRLALDVGRLDIAKQTLKVAESLGVNDWRTLSAQGTLHAKQGNHAEAQQYYLAALKEKPDAVSVINNLALSYALDGKAKKAEDLLRQAVASGQEDKRVRQNLALVLGLQGKFDEARQVAAVDMSDMQARSSMSYLRNMLSSSTQVAAAKPRATEGDEGEDWQPFAGNGEAQDEGPVRTAAATPAPPPAKVQMVKPVDQVTAPKAAGTKPAQARATPPTTTAAKTQPPTPTAITPPAKAPAQASAAGGASLLRTGSD